MDEIKDVIDENIEVTDFASLGDAGEDIPGPYDDVLEKKSMITEQFFADWRSRLKNLTPDQLDFRKLRKQYENNFKRLEPRCRMKKGNQYKLWCVNNKKIIDLMNRSIHHPESIPIGNIAVVLAYADSLLNFLEEISDRIIKVQDMQLLNTGHDNIIKKQQELIDALVQNLQQPISLDTFEKMVFEENTNG